MADSAGDTPGCTESFRRCVCCVTGASWCCGKIARGSARDKKGELVFSTGGGQRACMRSIRRVVKEFGLNGILGKVTRTPRIPMTYPDRGRRQMSCDCDRSRREAAKLVGVFLRGKMITRGVAIAVYVLAV